MKPVSTETFEMEIPGDPGVPGDLGVPVDVNLKRPILFFFFFNDIVENENE
jgi:hypothetical protein